MDLRRLHAFVKIVDIGSITRASSVLHIAQPALSQQIAALETHFGKPLLLRSKRGVVPTEAGKVFYKHCQLILKQLDQAEQEITSSSTDVSGFVSVGLAPLSLGSLLATHLMKTMRAEHPGIVLHINENVGGVISELIMTGKMDVALIYDPGGIPGVSFDPVQTEELYFVTTDADKDGATDISFENAVSDDLISAKPHSHGATGHRHDPGAHRPHGKSHRADRVDFGAGKRHRRRAGQHDPAAFGGQGIAKAAARGQTVPNPKAEHEGPYGDLRVRSAAAFRTGGHRAASSHRTCPIHVGRP